MGQRFYVITYRSEGKVYFFRGDNRYAIYLSRFPGPGWVESETEARLFVAPPDFGPKSVSVHIDGSKVSVHHFDDPVGRKNVIRPTRRPQMKKRPTV
jgi:hypothetical protein